MSDRLWLNGKLRSETSENDARDWLTSGSWAVAGCDCIRLTSRSKSECCSQTAHSLHAASVWFDPFACIDAHSKWTPTVPWLNRATAAMTTTQKTKIKSTAKRLWFWTIRCFTKMRKRMQRRRLNRLRAMAFHVSDAQINFRCQRKRNGGTLFVIFCFADRTVIASVVFSDGFFSLFFSLCSLEHKRD